MTIAIIPSSSGSAVQYTSSTSAFLGATSSVYSYDNNAIVMTGASTELTLLGTVVSDKAGVTLGTIGQPGENTVFVGLGAKVFGNNYGINFQGQGNVLYNFGEISSPLGSGVKVPGSSTAKTTIVNNGSITGLRSGIISFGEAVRLINNGSITGTEHSYYGDAGKDIVTNRGSLIGAVDVDQGDNVLVNFSSIEGNVSAGTGFDQLVNRGTVHGDIDLGSGGTVLTNWSVIKGNIVTGSDGDLVTNRGTIEGVLNLAEGNNVLTNRGLITANVQSDAGSDTIDNRGGTIMGPLNTGDNSDTVDNRGGTIVGHVDLGAGADVFNAGSGTEDVDAGAGTDLLNLSKLGSVVFALDFSLAQVGLGLNSDYENFESVIGSYAGTNTLVGNGLANVLQGGRNVDTLSGNGGNDTLDGRAGKDVLSGGAGTDLLIGGLGADTFVFSDKDTVAGLNDEILDFTSAEKDKIDLSAVDANSTLAGDQAFTFIGTAAFGHHAGELRTYTGVGPGALNYTFLTGDIDGDGNQDFAILFDHTPTIVKSDIVL